MNDAKSDSGYNPLAFFFTWTFLRIYAFYDSSIDDPSSFSLLIVIAVEGGSVAMTEVSF